MMLLISAPSSSSSSRKFRHLPAAAAPPRLPRRQRVLGLGFRYVFRLYRVGCIARLLHGLANGSVSGRWRGHRHGHGRSGHDIHAAADRAGDGIAVEVVKAGTALRVLTRAFGPTLGFCGHTRGSKLASDSEFRGAPCHGLFGLSKPNCNRYRLPDCRWPPATWQANRQC